MENLPQEPGFGIAGILGAPHRDLAIAASRSDHCQDTRLDCRRQSRPGLDHRRQFGVHWGVSCTECAGFCAAGYENIGFPPVFVGWFKSCPRNSRWSRQIATTRKPRQNRGFFVRVSDRLRLAASHCVRLLRRFHSEVDFGYASANFSVPAAQRSLYPRSSHSEWCIDRGKAKFAGNRFSVQCLAFGASHFGNSPSVRSKVSSAAHMVSMSFDSFRCPSSTELVFAVPGEVVGSKKFLRGPRSLTLRP